MRLLNLTFIGLMVVNSVLTVAIGAMVRIFVVFLLKYIFDLTFTILTGQPDDNTGYSWAPAQQSVVMK